MTEVGEQRLVGRHRFRGDPELRSGCRSAARDGALADALEQWAGAVPGSVLVVGPRGHALASADTAEHARHIWQSGHISDRDLGRESRFARRMLDSHGLAAVRGAATARYVDARDAWEVSATCAWTRLGIAERVLDSCTAYLGRRDHGGSTLLDRDMIKGQLWDSASARLEAEIALTSIANRGPMPALLRRVHRLISEADGTTLRLLGASGFLLDGPGALVHVSELLANIYDAEGTTQR